MPWRAISRADSTPPFLIPLLLSTCPPPCSEIEPLHQLNVFKWLHEQLASEEVCSLVADNLASVARKTSMSLSKSAMAQLQAAPQEVELETAMVVVALDRMFTDLHMSEHTQGMLRALFTLLKGDRMKARHLPTCVSTMAAAHQVGGC